MEKRIWEWEIGSSEWGMESRNAKFCVSTLHSPLPCHQWRLSSLDQKMSFNANCNCRDEPESLVGKRVPLVGVMSPKDVLPTVATRPGCPRFAWLKMSKISVRNWIRKLSVILVFLRIEKSTFLKSGPVMTFRPKLPKWKTPLLDTGSAKTELEVQKPAVVETVIRGSQTVLVNHGAGLALPMMLIGPIKSGLSGAVLTPLMLVKLVTMLIGLPLCNWVMLESCQPSTRRLPLKGNS